MHLPTVFPGYGGHQETGDHLETLAISTMVIQWNDSAGVRDGQVSRAVQTAAGVVHGGNPGPEEAPRILIERIIRPPGPPPAPVPASLHNETRIVLILAHLVTEPTYLRRRVDYNDSFAPTGACLTGFPKRAPVSRKISTSRQSRFPSGRGDFDDARISILIARLDAHCLLIAT